MAEAEFSTKNRNLRDSFQTLDPCPTAPDLHDGVGFVDSSGDDLTGRARPSLLSSKV